MTPRPGLARDSGRHSPGLRAGPAAPGVSHHAQSSQRESAIATAAPETPEPTESTGTSEANASTGSSPNDRAETKAGEQVADPVLADFLASSAECRDASEFKRTFDPLPDVDYGWVVAQAKEQLDDTVKIGRVLDDKATAIITFLGSGTGLLTVGLIAALADGKVNPWVTLCVLPAVICATVAVAFAVVARSPRNVYRPPDVRSAIRYAEFFPKTGAAAFLAQVHYAICLLDVSTGRKARLVGMASWGLVVSLGLLLLPLTVMIARKFADLP